MVCPNCLTPRHIFAYRELQRNPSFEGELNVIYQCPKKKGGCGHYFSPGEQRLLGAILSGDVVIVSREQAGMLKQLMQSNGEKQHAHA